MKKTIINSQWFLKPLVLLLFWSGYIISPIHYGLDPEILALASLILFGFFAMRPISYTFDKKYLSVNYVIGYRRKFEWDNITKIERGDTRFDYNSYVITAYYLEKGIVSSTANIPANKTTEIYIRKFWNGDFKS